MSSSTAVASHLDLRLALRRVKLDIRADRSFYAHPYELRLIEIDEKNWLERLSAALSNGTYSPQPQQICAVPKPKGHVRPGGMLRLEDQVYYTALVGACLPNILHALSDRRGPLDFSYRLSPNAAASEWLNNPFTGWERFRAESLAKLDGGAAFVLSIDLAGYYETIGHHRLMSDLRQHGVSNDITTALSDCLTRWSQIRGRGLPQGFSASDILAKLYLSEIDLAFAEMGCDHYRYVDDFRVFCSSVADARRAVVRLSGLTRARGLVFQTSKSSILPSAAARDAIDGIPQKIRTIKETYLREIVAAAGDAQGYFSMATADAMLSDLVDDAPLEVIERAYSEFVLTERYTFDKTLFHFLLKRLGTHGSRLALEHSVALLGPRPEETKYAIRYWRSLGIAAELDQALAAFLKGTEAVYAYQVHQLIEWRSAVEVQPESDLIGAVRRACFAGGTPGYLRTTCRRFLSSFGSLADLARIKEQYTHAVSELEKAEIMCCITRLEPASRNEFYKTASRDGDYPKRAERAVKTGMIP